MNGVYFMKIIKKIFLATGLLCLFPHEQSAVEKIPVRSLFQLGSLARMLTYGASSGLLSQCSNKVQSKYPLMEEALKRMVVEPGVMECINSLYADLALKQDSDAFVGFSENVFKIVSKISKLAPNYKKYISYIKSLPNNLKVIVLLSGLSQFAVGRGVDKVVDSLVNKHISSDRDTIKQLAKVIAKYGCRSVLQKTFEFLTLVGCYMFLNDDQNAEVQEKNVCDAAEFVSENVELMSKLNAMQNSIAWSVQK